MVIIKSKLTGQFLRQHSGSSNAFSRKRRWKVIKDQKFLDTLPKSGKNERDYGNFGPGKPTERRRAITREVHNRIYDAEPLEAHRFATAGSALTSIGKFVGSRYGVEARELHGIKGRQYALPEHLEIHEIVAGNLCIVDVNDDEETKRRKEKDCK
jgi:hypothetical protein